MDSEDRTKPTSSRLGAPSYRSDRYRSSPEAWSHRRKCDDLCREHHRQRIRTPRSNSCLGCGPPIPRYSIGAPTRLLSSSQRLQPPFPATQPRAVRRETTMRRCLRRASRPTLQLSPFFRGSWIGRFLVSRGRNEETGGTTSRQSPKLRSPTDRLLNGPRGVGVRGTVFGGWFLNTDACSSGPARFPARLGGGGVLAKAGQKAEAKAPTRRRCS